MHKKHDKAKCNKNLSTFAMKSTFFFFFCDSIIEVVLIDSIGNLAIIWASIISLASESVRAYHNALVIQWLAGIAVLIISNFAVATMLCYRNGTSIMCLWVQHQFLTSDVGPWMKAARNVPWSWRWLSFEQLWWLCARWNSAATLLFAHFMSYLPCLAPWINCRWTYFPSGGHLISFHQLSFMQIQNHITHTNHTTPVSMAQLCFLLRTPYCENCSCLGCMLAFMCHHFSLAIVSNAS